MRVDWRIRFKYATCEREIFKFGKKKLHIQKYPDTCGWGHSLTIAMRWSLGTIHGSP